MKEERLEILKMVADGIITVEEAERLLRAIEEGQRREQEGDWETKKKHRFSFKNLGEFGKFMEGIGNTISDVVGDLIGPLADEVLLDKDSFGQTITGELLDLPKDADLSVVSGKPSHHGKGGDLKIMASEDDKCHVLVDAQEFVLSQKEQKYVVRVDGDATVMVPSYLGSFSVATFHGDVEVYDLELYMTAKTMKGDVKIVNAAKGGIIKTLKGDIELSFKPDFKGELKASTMFGDIELVIPEEFYGELKVKTFKGDIELPAGLEVIHSKENGPVQEKVIRLGDTDSDNKITLSTFKGDIEVRRGSK